MGARNIRIVEAVGSNPICSMPKGCHIMVLLIIDAAAPLISNGIFFPAQRAGIRSTCPMLSISLLSPFSCLMASTVVSYLLDSSQSVSPGRTVYSI